MLDLSGVRSNPGQLQEQKKKSPKREPGELCSVPVPQFSHFKNENNRMTSLHKNVMKSKLVNICKVLRRIPGI